MKSYWYNNYIGFESHAIPATGDVLLFLKFNSHSGKSKFTYLKLDHSHMKIEG